MKKLLSLFIAILLIFTVFAGSVLADEYYIICNPKTSVNVRRSAKRASEKIGWLELGDMVESDGETENGYMLCYLSNEYGEGWVYKGYLTNEKPTPCGEMIEVIANGRVACRQYVNGKRQGWLKPGSDIKVYAYTSEWALTKNGFVKSEYLNLED